jgi:hypothetical protein
MKAVRITALVLIATAVGIACQDQALPTAPGVAPLFAKPGGGSKTGTVTLTGGFFTDSPQPVEIVTDGARKLELHADQSVFQGSINLANTIAAGTTPCNTDPAGVSEERKAELLARMADALQNRFFNAVVDRQNIGVPSEVHRVAHTWSEADGKQFSLRIGVASELLPGVYATVTEPSPNVFVYTGGAARIVDRTGSVPNHVYMACPNLDEVTVALTR